MPKRKQSPKVNLGPDYVLQCTGVEAGKKAPTDYIDLWYAGMTEGGYSTWRATAGAALRLRGPGLASAERALRRRGYVVQRVMVEA